MGYFMAGLGIVVVDQVTKLLVIQRMIEGESIAIFPPVFYITYVLNTGAAFGFLRGKAPLLSIFAVLGLVLVWVYRNTIKKQSVLTKWGITLAIAGALGNMIDRMRLGMVVDFIDIPLWPIFNVADMGIVFGVALLFWEVLTDGRK